MAYIKVDHSKFKGIADAIDSYTELMKKKMKSSQNEVAALAFNWQGKDYTNFKERFAKLDDDDSSHKQMIKVLEAYASFLRYAEEKYKKAQADAVERANRLPRY